MLKGKLHHGYHQLNFFWVFLEHVVGKLSKPLSGHNSKIHVASTARLIFTKHSSAPQLFSYMSLSCGFYLFAGLLIVKMRRGQVYTDRKCLLWSSHRESPPKQALLVLRSELRFRNLLRPGFSTSEVLAFGATDFRYGDCPLLCRMFSSVPDFDSWEASSTPSPGYDNQKCLQILPNVPQLL